MFCIMLSKLAFVDMLGISPVRDLRFIFEFTKLQDIMDFLLRGVQQRRILLLG
jgi:hypothetical protein